jgi:O-antigen/teichoic acid export membrane protein
MIGIVYPARYAAAGKVLGWLLAGSAALSLAEAALTMLSGAAGPRRPAVVLAVALACQLAIGAFLVPRHGAAGAAQATLIAAAVATLLAATSLRRLVGTELRARLLMTSILPLCCLAALAFGWSQRPSPRWATVAVICCAYGCYLALLWCLNAKELRRFMAGGSRLANPM